MEFQQLSISESGRHIIRQDGQPFFYLGDTAWELFHRANREDARLYLDDRAAKGFTAIQAVALAEFDGVRIPNAYGRYPLHINDMGEWDVTLPDTDGEYSYWNHVDYIVMEAAERGMYIALLPTWGDKFNQAWGKGPELFTPDSARAYGRWIGERYKDRPNIIWVLGGDRPLKTRRHFEVVCAMAQGLAQGDGGAHLISFHPTGGASSADNLHEEGWLSFNMIQSGHTRSRYNYEMIAKDYAMEPPKPVIDAEPGYEDHPESFKPQNGYMDAADVRQFAYMALLSGACGHTYGDHSIWGLIELPEHDFQPGHFCLNWKQALSSPGAAQMQHAKNLMLSRNILTSRPAPELVTQQLGGILHIPVLKGEDFLFAYTAQGAPIALKSGIFSGRAMLGWWYDPRNGEASRIGEIEGDAEHRFVPPSGGRGNDWILVLDAAARGYGKPGKR